MTGYYRLTNMCLVATNENKRRILTLYKTYVEVSTCKGRIIDLVYDDSPRFAELKAMIQGTT